jgi:UDP-N-acetylmuramoyl-tripeptide--D-alanyl-D-alanine ligase
MASLLTSEAAAAAGGRVVAGDPRAMLQGAAIDSRAVRGGELFFAFAGGHTDGHRFVGDAFARGAAGAMVHDLEAVAALAAGRIPAAGGGGPAVIQVADTLAALHDVARAVRARVPRRLIGITGSAGKTTTKELLAAMLGRRFRVARNPGNFNNQYGFPLALLNVADDAEWMVAEMGMSAPGEIRRLSLLGRPDVAVFTVVRPAHLEFFADLRGIADAKAELLDGLAPDGLVVANARDPEVVRIARRAGGRRVIWYGLPEEPVAAAGAATAGWAAAAAPRQGAAAAGPAPDVTARDVRPAAGGADGADGASGADGARGAGSRLVLVAGGREQEVELHLHGLYNVENFLAAAACAWALDVPLADVAAAAGAVRPAAGRGVVRRLAGPRGELTLIDDSYNSNPDALGKALAAAAGLPAARRLAVLGDMLELGPESPAFHRQGGLVAARLGFGPLAGVGVLARELVAGAREGGAAAAWFADAAGAADWAEGTARPGDLVLIKGSRGVGLDAVVRRLQAAFGGGSAAGGSTAGGAAAGGGGVTGAAGGRGGEGGA